MSDKDAKSDGFEGHTTTQYTVAAITIDPDVDREESFFRMRVPRSPGVPLILEDLQAAKAEIGNPSEVELLRRQVATLRMRLDLMESVERVTRDLVRSAFEEGAERRSMWQESKAFTALYGHGEE